MLYRKMLQVALVATLVAFSSSALAQNICPHDMNAAKLLDIFKSLAMRASLDNDTVIVEFGENEEPTLKVLLQLDSPKKLLFFTLVFGFKEGTPQSERIMLSNKLNYTLVLARFYVTPEGMLCADYALSYEAGLDQSQIIISLSWIQKIVTGGIMTYDENKIVN